MTSDRTPTATKTDADMVIDQTRDDTPGERVTIRLRDSWPIWSGSQMKIRSDAADAAFQ